METLLLYRQLQDQLRQWVTPKFMLLDCASLIALMLGMMLVQAGERSRLDWHGERGLSFLATRSVVRFS